MRIGARLFIAVLALGCGDDEPPKPAPPSPVVEQKIEPPAAALPLPVEPLPEGTSEAALLERAQPAWGAVLERASLLSRRGQRGAAWGRIAILGDTTWLIDDTATAAGLGIRIARTGGAPLAVSEGMRVLVHGAWVVDEKKRWVWKVERMVGLSGTGTGSGSGSGLGTEPLPGKLLRTREGSDSEGGDRGGDEVPTRERERAFWVMAGPARPGDGWAIGDVKEGPVVATLLLPGELLGAPYGGLDYRAPDERWQLQAGKSYAAPISEVQLRRKLPLPVLRATAPPVALP